MKDAVLYSSCYNANICFLDTLSSNEDAILSDSLNHPSLFDAIRLSKAKYYEYPNHVLETLESQLKSSLAKKN